jgi:uroporphyrinogen-III synthase
MTLAGRRIVVTRTEEQAGSLVDGLRQRGATPVLVPSIRFEPPEDAAPLAEAVRDLDEAAWVVFTSTTGVLYGWAEIQRAWPDGLPDGVRVAAVGSGTAGALRAVGAPVDLVPREALGDVLVDELPIAAGDRVVLLRSHIGREALATGLAARGADVCDVPAYRTLTEADTADVSAALDPAPDAVTFTSPSTVRGFLEALSNPTQLADVPLVAIGPVTAAALEPAGLRAAAVADPHTVAGVLDALDQLFA